MTTDSDCDNSQYDKDEIRDNSQSDTNDNSQSVEDEDIELSSIQMMMDFWIGCDGCNDWFDFKSTNIKSKKHVPDEYYSEKC